jgi:galactokinase
MAAAQALGVGLLVETDAAAVERDQARLTPEAFKRAKHIVDEIARVAESRSALARGDLAAVGRLLTASHRSSQFLFENSTAELDFLVDVLTATEHVFGARLTGGGFGGAVMAMTSGAFGEAQAQAVVAAYRARFGAAPDVLHTQTGDGATLL